MFCLSLRLADRAAAHGPALQHAATALAAILVCPALVRGADLRLRLLNGAAAHGPALQHTAASLTAILVRPALVCGASQVGGLAIPAGEVVVFNCKIGLYFILLNWKHFCTSEIFFHFGFVYRAELR